jgi:hypothetical protein
MVEFAPEMQRERWSRKADRKEYRGVEDFHARFEVEATTVERKE